MIEERLYFIYHLIDPRNNKIFYVGQTLNPNKRKYCHRKTKNRDFKINPKKQQLLKN